MNYRVILATTAAVVTLVTGAGCAVTSGQQGVGAYVDDATITTAVKARMVDNKNVDANAIQVETLNGTVQLTGFAKNGSEKSVAESLAWKVAGVKSVKNQIAIQP